MPSANPKLPQLLVTNSAKQEPFTTRSKKVKPKSLPERERSAHGNRLKDQLKQAQWDANKEHRASEEEARALGIALRDGMYLEFDIVEDQLQVLKSLESGGIELITVVPITRNPDVKLARVTVYVPRGQLGHFEKKITQYLAEETSKGRPKNEPLITSIEDIRLATLQSLWTDTEIPLPLPGKRIWWEVWLRRSDGHSLRLFEHAAKRLGIRIDSLSLKFPERRIVLVDGTREQLTKSMAMLDLIAELRQAKELASAFTELDPYEQADWRDDLQSRLTPPLADAPAVCLLDTGVNREHRLLAPALDAADLHSYDPKWGVHDHDKHGTEMAGIALYGDLEPVLASSAPVILQHRLESVKILPLHDSNDPALYGAITIEAVGRAEIQAPHRTRAVCMTVTTTDGRDRGQPSSWSAEIDELCSGARDQKPRLFVVSAGNTDKPSRANYPSSNVTDGLHDPAQAWNALTVGAFTDRVRIEGSQYDDWTAMAEAGALSPSSTTACTWDAKKWPIKPDFVMEGGNMARRPDGTVDYVDSLQLLTTHWKPLVKSFVSTGDTSAATAQAARLAAIIHSQYPAYWPETVRALLVHSAQWTPAMEKHCPLGKKTDLAWRLQHYGFGIPDQTRALWCASNHLTLVAQDVLQPYECKGGSRYGTKEMHLHSFPWPKEELRSLGETLVELRVTLSYYIEPSPGRRGWNYRHRYPSHGLRFDIKTARETVPAFRRRINAAAAAAQEESDDPSKSDSKEWLLGPQLRHRGSLHADRWNGTAADLAEREILAIYPVMGWWREHSLRSKSKARYALVISIHAPRTDVDIYAPVAQQLKTAVPNLIVT